MFGIKDLFTTINVLGGAFAIFLCVEGRPFEAGVAVILGYLLGDVPDGWVARKLRSANAFGAEYDTIADHLAHTIAPAAIVYTVYAQAPLLPGPTANKLLGAALGGSIMIASSIRHARNIVQPVKYRGVWSGLPRTVLGFLVIGYSLSATVQHVPEALWAGAALVPLLSIATLTRLPFSNHHLPRPHFAYVRFLIAVTFASLIGLLLFYPRLTFDLLFVSMAAYSLGSFVVLTPEERSAYQRAVDAARAAGSQGAAA
jgi:phosphatidylserine synthase